MGYTWDPEVWQGVKPIFEAAASGPKAPVGDALARRNAFEPLLAHMVGALPPAPDVKTHDYYARATDGHEVLCRWFYKADAPSQPGPAIVHCHGGGMILGTVPLFSPAIAAQVSLTGVPMLSVDYRRAPEHPHPTLVEDCYVGLIWLRDHAKELNVDPARIAVMGESAGGGIAAGLALLARDRKFEPPLAKQILIYPMLDDRNTVPNEKLVPFMFWTYEDNITGWGALLGKDAGGSNVPYYAAPARADDLSGLPPTYIDVGQLDIFIYEDLDYAKRLTQDGVAVELHVHPGVCHAFEALVPTADVSQRATQDRFRAMKGF